MKDKIRPLNSIKTDEEYENHKKYLDRYLNEYKLFKEKDNLAQLMETRAKEYEEGEPARTALEQRIRLIKNGEYGQALERNITAYMLTLKEYEAKKENRSLFDVIKGIITKDEDTKEYLERRYMKSRAENNGFPEVVNLNLQDPYDVVRQIFEEHEFINIEKPEEGLVPVDTEVNKVFEKVREMLSDCLEENGISMDNKEKIETLRVEKTPYNEVKKIEKTPIVKDNSKEKDDFGDEI